ncbi:MAG TPA: copper resistance protein CopC, partial [Pilimelia sp.]|nr:copper resistance protein CopC [Pilimelia sp.]
MRVQTGVGGAVRRVGAAGALAVAGVLAVAGPAAAHDGAVSSTPAAGAYLVRPPGEVTVRMTGPTTRATVEVTDGCGRRIPTRVSTSGERITARLVTGDDGQGSGGSWVARWRVVGSDGHATAGDVPFTVRGVPRCEVAPQPTQRAAGAVPGDRQDGAPAAGADGPGGDVHRHVAPGAPSADTSVAGPDAGLPV